MFSESSLESAIQDISRKRASGVLHITADESSLDVVVVKGVIVHVEQEGASKQLAVCDLLQRAGCLADSVLELLSQSEVSIEQLRQVLVQKNYLSEWEFDQAKRAYEMNLLYGVGDSQNVAVDFLERSVAPGPADMLRVLPTQLLLDIVELEVDEPRFTDIFNSSSGAEVLLQLDDSVDEQVLSSDEQIICGIIADGGTVADVFELSLLSRHSVVVSLLSLLEKGFISTSLEEEEPFDELEDVEDDEALEEAAASADEDDDDDEPVEPLEDGGDLFEGLFDDELEAESTGDVAAGDGVFDGQGVWGAFDGADGDIDPGKPVSFDDLDSVEEEEEEEDMPFPAELEAESNRWAEKENDTSNFTGAGAMIRSLNYRLSEPQVMQNIVVVVTSVYLLMLAIVVPDMVEQWFNALSEFTTNAR